MSNDRLIAALDPWMRVSTWHTSHPLDDERFHRALAAAFAAIGTPIDAEQFEDAMLHLARKHHGAMEPEHLMQIVDELAQKAEEISLYVHHTRD